MLVYTQVYDLNVPEPCVGCFSREQTIIIQTLSKEENKRGEINECFAQNVVFCYSGNQFILTNAIKLTFAAVADVLLDYAYNSIEN